MVEVLLVVVVVQDGRPVEVLVVVVVVEVVHAGGPLEFLVQAGGPKPRGPKPPAPVVVVVEDAG